MKTKLETPIQKREGKRAYSIALNETGCTITPFATHLKIYEKGEEPYFVWGDYHRKLRDAMASFEQRCIEDGIQY